jgi:hypothetical protein
MPEKNAPFMRRWTPSRQFAFRSVRERLPRIFIQFASFLILLSIFGCSRPANRAEAVIPPPATPAPLPAFRPPAVSTIVSQPASDHSPPLDRAPDPRGLEQRYALASSTPEAREEIIQQLGEIGNAQAVVVLSRLFQREKRAELQIAILGTIGGMENDNIFEEKLAFLSRAIMPMHSRLLREVAINTLADVDDPRAIPLLQTLRFDGDAQIRTLAGELLRDLAK